MSKQAVYEAVPRLMEQHGLDGSFCMVIIKAGPEDVIVVAAIRGHERKMPQLPDMFEGFSIERTTIGRPIPCPATKRRPRAVRQQGDDDGPWSFNAP